MKKFFLAIVSLILGILFFVLLYDFVLWDKIVFPQILKEPAIGRDLNIRKELYEKKFLPASTFVFGSSRALNGINCHVLENEGRESVGECYNLGVPGDSLSLTNYLWDVARTKPKNIILVAEYEVFHSLSNAKAAEACNAVQVDILLEPQKKNFLFQLGFWNGRGFLERWSYKNRLVDAMVGINESKGYGMITRDFKNPIFILGVAGKMREAADQAELVKLFALESGDPKEAVCASSVPYFLNASATIQQLSSQTNIFIVVYPSHPVAVKALSLSEGLLERGAFDTFAASRRIRIVNFLNLLTEDGDWADRTHASRAGVDKISEAFVQCLKPKSVVKGDCR